FDCRVHGIDLSPAFVAAATYLAERVGLAGKVAYQCGDAQAMPYESVVAGPERPAHFPVPWSRGPATTFLVTPTDMRSVLELAGFRVVDWKDSSEAGIAWSPSSAKRAPRRRRPAHRHRPLACTW